jgi:hypothetical protein
MHRRGGSRTWRRRLWRIPDADGLPVTVSPMMLDEMYHSTLGGFSPDWKPGETSSQ